MHDDPADMFFGLLIIILLIGLVVAVIDGAIFAPDAAEEASNYCHSHGYDNYVTFSRHLFGTQALGVQCSYAQKQVIVATNVTGMIVSTK